MFIEVTTKSLWDDYLSKINVYEIYHTFDYNKIESQRVSGDAIAFVFKNDENFIFFPLIVRPFKVFCDATSSYGYPGPLATNQSFFDYNFNKLIKYISDKGVISIFSRSGNFVSPSFDKYHEWKEFNKTVFIDLKLSNEDRRKQYSTNHKRDIKRLEKEGFVVNELFATDSNILKFKSLYDEEMLSKGASKDYFFNFEYYKSIFESKDFKSLLVEVKFDNKTCAMGVFFLCQDICQYHLGFTVGDYRKKAPFKILFDQLSEKLKAKGISKFHLGGGMTSDKNDFLFKFKYGFSNNLSNYYLYKKICNKSVYNCLVENIEHKDFFPLYRSKA